jgi:membrane protein required for beta-lactamase induction
MKLIAILLVLATEEKWKSFRSLRPYQALIEFACRLQARLGERDWFNGPAGVLLVLAPGLIAIGLLQVTIDAADGLIAWLVGLAFAAAVLMISIGRRNADDELEDYLHALDADDPETAYRHVREVLQGEDPGTPAGRHRLLIETLLLRNHERLLAVLFWFVVLGPVGAVLYRTASQLKGVRHTNRSFDEGFIDAVLRLQGFLDWIPVRIAALCHALVGSFSEALHEWRAAAATAFDLPSGNRGVLIGSGLGSLRLRDDLAVEGVDADAFARSLAETRALIYRTMIVWVTAFAVLTIVGWLN